MSVLALEMLLIIYIKKSNGFFFDFFLSVWLLKELKILALHTRTTLS